MTLWDEVFDAVAAEYPDVTTERVLVDAMAARFVLKPESLDVVVASNLFADILTDLGGAVVGGLGMAPSANLNPERRYPSMFEPVHGSAPDIFGQGVANPIAMIWSGSLMLDFLGETQAAELIFAAIKATTAAGSRSHARPGRPGQHGRDGRCDRRADAGVGWRTSGVNQSEIGPGRNDSFGLVIGGVIDRMTRD